MAIKAVLFDLDDTLYDREELVRKVVTEQYDDFQHELRSVQKDDFVSRVLQLDDQGCADKRSLYATVVGEWGLAPGLIERLAENFWISYDNKRELPQDTRMTLETLQRNGIKLGVITNGGAESQQRKLESLGISSWFDVILISETEGVKKPDTEIFHRALTRCGVEASEAIFVGDHPDTDIGGALQAGLRAVWKVTPYWPCSHDVPFIRRLSEILPMCGAETPEPIGRREFVAKAGRAALGMSALPFVASCSRALQPPPTSYQDRSAEALIADLENRIPQLMRDGNVPGVSVAIIRNAKLFWRRGFGVKDIATNEPVDNDTVFEAASTSKPVFAYAVMKLCERGVMDLDTPLTKYAFPRYLEGDPRLDLITARHVLSHTSGFQNFRTRAAPLSISFTPGAQWAYSGEGYSYLQSVVTQLAGGRVNPKDCGRFEAGLEVCAMEPSIDEYMKANVLAPFGMTSSGYFWDDTIEGHMAHGHLPDGKRSEMIRKPSGPAVARYGMVGGLCTTPTDYAKFLIELIDPKPSDAIRLNEKSRAEMLRPQIRSSPWSHWALGWEVEHTDTGDVIKHGGGNPGYACIVVASIEHKTGYVIMTNAEDIGYFNVIAKLIGTEPLASLLGNRLHTNNV